MAQSGNPGGESRCISDIPTEKCVGWRGLRSDGVGLRVTQTEKYTFAAYLKDFWSNKPLKSIFAQ